MKVFGLGSKRRALERRRRADDRGQAVRILATHSDDDANQLQPLVEATGTTTFTFDASRNQQIENAPSSRTTNTWDYETQLTRVALPSGARVTMAHNADFLRVRKET